MTSPGHSRQLRRGSGDAGRPAPGWPNIQHRSPGVTTIAGVFTVALGVLALYAGPTWSLDARLRMAAFGSVVVGTGCFALIRPHARARDAPLLARLGPATIVLYTFSFGVFGLAWLAPQSGSKVTIDPVQIPGAAATSMLGLVALTVGYVVGPPGGIVQWAQRRVATMFPAGPRSLRVPSMALLLYAVGTGARIVRLSTGQYGYFQDASQTLSSPTGSAQLLSLLEEVTTIAVVAAAIDHFILSRSTRSRVVLVVLTTLEISIGLVSASKEGVLFTLLALALVKAFSGRPVRLATVLAGGLLVSLLFPFTSDYRNTLRGGESGQISPATALGQVPAVVGRTAQLATPRSVLVDGPSAVARRLRQVDNVAIVRQKTPSAIAYRPWSEVATGPVVAVVPRALWPSKPIVSTGRDFSLDYYELPPSVYSATAVTVPGDLYRHGGIAPLVVGMTVFGLILRFFDRALSPRHDPRHLIVYVPVFLHLLKIESDVTVFAVGLLQLLLLAALTSWLVFAPSRGSRRAVQRIHAWGGRPSA